MRLLLDLMVRLMCLRGWLRPSPPAVVRDVWTSRDEGATWTKGGAS